MDVSVIIPCFNAEKYIDKCMNVLLNDKLKNIEIIMINDGSTDKTLKILNDYKKKYNNVIVLNQKNSGQAVARNNGLKLAKGKFIAFVDIDDFPSKDMLYTMYNYAIKNKCDYVFCDYYEYYFDNNKIVSNFHNKDKCKNAILTNFAPWGKLISKSLIDKIHFEFLEEKIFEDIAVIPVLGALSKNPGYIKQPLYYYNMTNISTTRKKNYDKRFENIILVSNYLYESVIDNNLLDSYYEEFAFVFLDGILKSGVLIFARYKEGIKNIKLLRKNVKAKFPKLLKNKYYKQESLYRRLTIWLAYYCPARILYLLKKFKG